MLMWLLCLVQVHVNTIICPVTLSYEPEHDTYRMGDTEMQLVRQSVAGHVNADEAPGPEDV